MTDFTGNHLYEYLEKDLGELTNEDLDSLLEEAQKRNAGHPSGSSAAAQSQSLINRAEKEINKRETTRKSKVDDEDLRLSRDSFGLNKLILRFTIISVVLSLIGIVIALFKK